MSDTFKDKRRERDTGEAQAAARLRKDAQKVVEKADLAAELASLDGPDFTGRETERRVTDLYRGR